MEPITLCIINYNGAVHLARALEAALASTDVFAEILVVDNHSTDDSLSMVKSRFAHVAVCLLERNRGPAAARNAGWAAASNDLILFQDNDVRLTCGCATILRNALHEHPRALLVAPRVLYASRPDIVQYDSADCHVLGLMALRHANRPAREVAVSLRPTTSLVTACFLIDRRRWTGPTLFDEDFEFNLEDHDFGVRANVWGHETWIEPHACVLHGGGTPGLSYRPGYALSSKRVFYLIRNRWWSIGKNYSSRTLLLLSPLLLLYELFQLAGLAKNGWLREWWSAFISCLRHFPQLRRKRAIVQARRVIRDRCILRSGPLPFTGELHANRVEQAALRLLERTTNAYWTWVQTLL